MFNSRNPIHRCPTGAVPNCMPVHFKITMPRDLKCSAARLIVKDDVTGAEQALQMFWCGMNGDNYEWWECHYTAKDPGLYFYWFYVDTWRGTLKMTRGFGGEGTVQDAGGRVWQLTVYDRDFSTPDWLAGGIMYQIFPDRFYCSGRKKTNIPADRKIHENWKDQPDWAPNEQGKITNTDYFGGDLRGIEEKLDYLKSLGVTCIYLNPIFESHSNHRYDTADYSKVDSLLGDEEDFSHLCKTAEKKGIRVILDGVFSHTGSDSVYFNRQNRYAEEGAYNSQNSPYYPWYTFRKWPDEYDCWWDFITLPNVNELNPQYNEYINGRGGIIQKWIAAGASGWRLDVADELPDAFIDHIRVAAKSRKNDSLILGEVWEDASNKTAYGYRRRYLLGGQLDSVMNYPFRNAILGFLTGANPADMMEIIMNIIENYPPQVTRLLMNHIGTHDTERALTMLAGEPLRGHGRHWQSTTRLTKDRRQRGLKLMRLAALMQYTLPGVPCIYYGDEAGAEGYRDPFNRTGYPWGEEDKDLIQWYQRLGRLRASCSSLKEGGFYPLIAGDGCIAYIRKDENDALLCALNACGEGRKISVPSEWRDAQPVIGNIPDENNQLFLEPESCAALILKQKKAEKPVEASINKTIVTKTGEADRNAERVMEAYTVKKLKESDLPEALALVWKVFLEFEAPEYCAEGVEEFKNFIQCESIQEKLDKSEFLMWGCFNEKKIVGVIAVRPPFHISLLFVDKEYHRKGIARSLFNTILDYCRKDGKNTEITVNSSPYAQEVYHKLGFKDTNTEQEVNGIRFTPMRFELSE